MASSKTPRAPRLPLTITDDLIQNRQRKEAAKIGQEELAKARLVSRSANAEVPDRVGGKTPPSTPFARRRAFGLRALDH